MDILFVAGVAAIVADPPAAFDLYAKTLGLPLSDDEYPATGDLEGVKHFGLWPLADAARSCFGTAEWPAGVPVPQTCIELEVADVDAAAAELEAAGHTLVRAPADEPWGQRTARLLTGDGLLLGVTWTPWMHEEPRPA
jgi:catechol 2,3-dioxygenase-like lactoylglutathione lyase family enzyme